MTERSATVHVGFKVGSGEQISVPIRNMAVTGQTQESGKTTTLEALVARSGLKAITFVTKRGETSFAAGRRLKPYFRERADWQFVDALIEAALGEKNKFLRQFLIPVCRTTRTLKDVQTAIREGLKKASGQKAGAFVQLDAYLELIVPEIERASLASKLELQPGLNVMDIAEFSRPMQMLFVQSAIDWVNEREQGTVVVIPEAWDFIPEGKGSPVKASAVALVRKGSAIGNHIWIDSQDMAGVDKVILRGCPVWLIGVQREINEIKRNIANIPPPTGKPKPADVAMLELGQFFVCFGKTLAKTYVQPVWMKEETARSVAMTGMTKGFPKPPTPMIAKPQEDRDVKESEARSLRERNENLEREVHELKSEIAQLSRASRLDPVVRHDLPSEKVSDVSCALPTDTAAFYADFKRRLMEDGDPAVIRLLTSKPEIDVKIERQTIEIDESKLIGRVAAMIVDGFFDQPTTASAAFADLQRRGKGSAKPNVYKACDDLTTMGFLTKEKDGYRVVPKMKINIV